PTGRRRAGVLAAAGGVERAPAVRAEHLDPRVGVRLADDVIAADGVELVALEPADHAGLDAEALEHERHRAGEIFTVAALQVVEERDQRVLAFGDSAGVAEVERVTEFRAQMVLDVLSDLLVEGGDLFGDATLREAAALVVGAADVGATGVGGDLGV